MIGGEWVPAASGATFPVIDPSSGMEIARVAEAGAADVDAAVAAARRAFEDPSWRGMAPEARERLMNLEYQHALAEISEWTLGARGRLNIAAGPAWIGWILPPVIAEFQNVYPDVRVTLTGGGVELQLEQLLSGEVDVVCGPVDFPAHAEMVTEPLTRLRHSIIAREGHPLANRRIVPPKEIAGYSWVILTNDPFSSSRVGAYFVANGLEPPRVVMETNAFGALAMVRCSDLLTSFASVAEPVLKQLSLTVIRQQGTFWDFEAGLTRLKATRPSGPLNGFRTILRSHLADAD